MNDEAEDAQARSSPWSRTPRSRRSTVLTSVVTSLTSLAVAAGLAIRPGSLTSSRDEVSLVGDSYDSYDAKVTEQLRGDRCLAADALRMGGSNMFALAQQAAGLPPG
ncbi:hypothetical protein ACIBCO_37575 [Streptomyces violascens]|uniref:hypothetical protein n=1 Tax=Streptomyces violascens TaxID=67381 RepID=UPI0037BC7BFA